jgi:hypothetical protein
MVPEIPEIAAPEAVPASSQKPEPSPEPRITLKVRADEPAEPARVIPLATARHHEQQHGHSPLTVVGNRVDDPHASPSPLPLSPQANRISETRAADPATAYKTPPHAPLADLEAFLAAIIRMRTARATAR